jgi:hypothetical protein
LEETKLTEAFETVFESLKQIMVDNSEGYTVLHDEPGKYYLQTPTLNKNKQPIWFGGVEIKKNYVSYHLFAVYCQPKLMSQMSDGLKKRMQGKACFNFKSEDETLFRELADLTASCRNAFSSMVFV